MLSLGEVQKPPIMNDCFTQLLEEIRQEATDESQVERLLTERIIKDFIARLLEDSKNIAKLKREEESLKNKNGFASELLNAGCIPKRKRLMRRRPSKVSDSLVPFIESSNEKQPLVSDIASSSGRNSRDEEDEVEEKRMRKKRKMKMPQEGLALGPEPSLPEEFRATIQSMKGMDIKLVMRKELTNTDTAKQQNRLSIPRNQIRSQEFLNEEEKKKLDEMKGIETEVITPCKDTIKLTLRKWIMTNTFSYNLIGGWCKNVVAKKTNGLEPGRMIQLWSFRKDSELCFVLINEDH